MVGKSYFQRDYFCHIIGIKNSQYQLPGITIFMALKAHGMEVAKKLRLQFVAKSRRYHPKEEKLKYGEMAFRRDPSFLLMNALRQPGA